MEKRELEIYLHIPFCVRKCGYCDFLSAPASDEMREQYVQSLTKEIRQFSLKGDYVVSTVFFGGGTPSLLTGGQMAELMGALRENFCFAEDAAAGRTGPGWGEMTGSFPYSEREAVPGRLPRMREERMPLSLEITVECNPGTADAEKLAAYRRAGINRLSIGLQSADNGELKALGRIHTWEEFLDTFQAAREAGFSNINVDLMSALPGQTASSWERTLRQVLALKPEHVSAYSLIIEEGTPFYEKYGEDDARRQRGEEPFLLPSEEEEREMYRLTQAILREYGLDRYEISNYALPGYECRHNIGYWTGVEYAGFGLGASSLLRHTRSRNTQELAAYLAGKIHGESVPLTERDQMEEFMFLGLRLAQGVSEAEFRSRFGHTLEEIYGPVLARLQRQGLLWRKKGRLYLTPSGIDVSNYVLADFLL